MGLEDFAPGIKAYYEGCTTMAEIAKKAAAMEGGDFVVLNLEGGDPNGVNKSTEELIAIVKRLQMQSTVHSSGRLQERGEGCGTSSEGCRGTSGQKRNRYV